jgi:hypothetical protein
MTLSERDKFEKWLRTGIKKGWCSEPKCGTHDVFLSDEELDEYLTDFEGPCYPLIRVYGMEQAL